MSTREGVSGLQPSCSEQRPASCRVSKASRKKKARRYKQYVDKKYTTSAALVQSMSHDSGDLYYNRLFKHILNFDTVCSIEIDSSQFFHCPYLVPLTVGVRAVVESEPQKFVLPIEYGHYLYSHLGPVSSFGCVYLIPCVFAALLESACPSSPIYDPEGHGFREEDRIVTDAATALTEPDITPFRLHPLKGSIIILISPGQTVSTPSGCSDLDLILDRTPLSRRLRFSVHQYGQVYYTSDPDVFLRFSPGLRGIGILSPQWSWHVYGVNEPWINDALQVLIMTRACWFWSINQMSSDFSICYTPWCFHSHVIVQEEDRSRVMQDGYFTSNREGV